jgi:hypothetical protein
MEEHPARERRRRAIFPMRFLRKKLPLGSARALRPGAKSREVLAALWNLEKSIAQPKYVKALP